MMKKDKIIESIKNGSLKFKDLDDSYKNGKEVILEALQHNAMELQFASKELRNDKKVVLAAVQKNGTALYFTSDELKNEIGGNNPIKYLISYFLNQKLVNKNNNLIIKKKI